MSGDADKTPRWVFRFANFERAFNLLKAPLEERKPADFNLLEKEGLIQRFELCFELSWKVLKDYLEFSGITLDQISPRPVIKQAFAARIIKDGQAWIDMLERRNLLSHTYDRSLLDRTLDDIRDRFLPALEQEYNFLRDQHREL